MGIKHAIVRFDPAVSVLIRNERFEPDSINPHIALKTISINPFCPIDLIMMR
jgi:hypothetical protein